LIAAALKKSVIPKAVEGKDIAVVDDSLVRGTVARTLIHTFKDKGANSVHFVVGTPPYIHPCPFNRLAETETIESLIATGKTHEKIQQEIGSDSLIYLPMNYFDMVFGNQQRNKVCATCFTGKLPERVR